MKFVGLVAVALVAVLVAVSCANSGVEAQNSWDYLLLVQQWGPGVCASSRQQCVIPSYVRYWTIHGMWPNNDDGSYPTNCPDSESFSMQRLQPIAKTLQAYWPTLFPDNTLESFWEHEFNKHGTCAASDPKLRNELAYFNATLNARASFDLSVALSQAGISTSSSTTYSMNAISQAVRNAYGGQPLIQCGKELSRTEDGKSSAREVLSSVGLCLGADLTIMDCPSNLISKEGCRSYNGLYYLPF
jgi:ribonuclease T2